LRERAGVADIYLEQLYTFGDPKRDLRQRSVSVAYFALVNNDRCTPKKTEYISDISWHSVKNIPKLAFDHDEIVKYGLERLRSKLAYTNIAYGLLPKKFTLSELQTIYEAIIGKGLDRRNFRKKIQALGLVRGIGEKRHQGKSRPAQLFVFTKQKPQVINIL
jgi:8-oxo-dGTP diphosphatase